jgi:hypothetical protein
MAMPDLELLARRGCATVVASVAAYASYEHQRTFALDGGADPAGASLWPLSVDGLLVLATIGLLKPQAAGRRRTRYAVRLAFGLGIAVSLAANVAAAPRLAWQPVLVAGWPPVALLLAVELLATGSGRRECAERADALEGTETPRPETGTPERESESAAQVSGPPERSVPRESHSVGMPRPRSGESAEEAMWAYFQQECSQGRTPTGAELDRAVGTNNYGRAVLARWRRAGRIPETPDRVPPTRPPGAVLPREPDPMDMAGLRSAGGGSGQRNHSSRGSPST